MRMLVITPLCVALGCGGAGSGSAGAARNASTESGVESPAREPVVTTCAPERSPLRYELVDLPSSIVAGAGRQGECTLLPRDGEDMPLAFAVQLLARERPLDAGDLGATPEERLGDEGPIVARGELTLLGAPTRWVALGGEQPWVGEGEARYAFVELTRHTLDVSVLFAAATPEPVRTEVMAALSKLRVVGTERATDAWRHDRSRAVCEADGVPLVVPVPDGAVHQVSWATQCMVGPPGDPQDPAWSMWIGSVEPGSELGALVAPEPGGTRAWAESALEGSRVIEESTVSFLGATTPLITVDADDEQGRARRYVLARARHGDRFLLAILTTAPDDATHRAQLIEALAGVRAP